MILNTARQPRKAEEPMKNAAIFDLDGTLWDSTPYVHIIWNRVFARHPQTDFRVTQKDAMQCMGRTMEEIGEILMPGLDISFRKRIMDEIGEEEVVFLKEHGGDLYEGVRETLADLKETYDLFIVSNCQDGYVQAFLSAHGFEDCFKDIEMSGRTGLSKGENIRLIMQRNKIVNAVYIGDTQGDRKAAADADIPFIHAAYGFGKVSNADAVILDITCLPSVLCRFQKI